MNYKERIEKIEKELNEMKAQEIVSDFPISMLKNGTFGIAKRNDEDKLLSFVILDDKDDEYMFKVLYSYGGFDVIDEHSGYNPFTGIGKYNTIVYLDSGAFSYLDLEARYKNSLFNDECNWRRNEQNNIYSEIEKLVSDLSDIVHELDVDKADNVEESEFPTSMLKAGTFGAVEYGTTIDYFVLVPEDEHNFRMVYSSGGYDILGHFDFSPVTGCGSVSKIVYLDNDAVCFDDAEMTYENEDLNGNNWFRN